MPRLAPPLPSVAHSFVAMARATGAIAPAIIVSRGRHAPRSLLVLTEWGTPLADTYYTASDMRAVHGPPIGLGGPERCKLHTSSFWGQQAWPTPRLPGFAPLHGASPSPILTIPPRTSGRLLQSLAKPLPFTGVGTRGSVRPSRRRGLNL